MLDMEGLSSETAGPIRKIPDHATFRKKGEYTGLVRQA